MWAEGLGFSPSDDGEVEVFSGAGVTDWIYISKITFNSVDSGLRVETGDRNLLQLKIEGLDQSNEDGEWR